MRPSREGRGYWSSRARDRTPSDARMRARPSGRAVGGLCWATRDRAHGSASKPSARPCARMIVTSFAISSTASPATRIARNPASTPLPCCARSSGSGGSTRSENWSLTPTNAAIAITPRRSSPRSRPSLRAAQSTATRSPPSALTRAGVELAELVALVYRKMAAAPVPTQTASPVIGVAFTGGVLTHIARVRAAMTTQLAVSLPAACVRQSPVDPLEGALWRARQG